jgi:hypothetical protein
MHSFVVAPIASVNDSGIVWLAGSLSPTIDAGKVRLGAYAPTLSPTIDTGKVRLGAYAPTLSPTVDAGKVRLG